MDRVYMPVKTAAWRLLLFLLLLVVIISLTHAEDKHLICKQVEDVFTSTAEDGRTSRNVPLVQGPPGKRGPKGIKGEKGTRGDTGARGSPGNVNYVIVNETVENAFQILVRRLDQMQETINMLKKVACGAVHRANCFQLFWFPVDQPYNEAKAICESVGFRVADVDSKEVYDVIVTYVREQMTESVKRLFLSNTYNPQTKVIKLSDGEVSTFTSWYPGRQYRNGSHTQFILEVSKDVNSKNQGMYNYPPSSRVSGVLCVK